MTTLEVNDVGTLPRRPAPPGTTGARLSRNAVDGHWACWHVGARVSVVIPTLNEALNIGWVLERLPDFVDEVILVDGRSTDRTVEVARAVRPDLVVVEEPTHGKGVALRSGFAAATGDYIVMLDADGSMDPAEITNYVALLRHGHDFVKGSRFICGGGSSDFTWVRRVGAQRLVDVANRLYGARFTDLCYGYVAFRRDCLPRLGLTADGFEIETELILRAWKGQLKMAELPSLESRRLSGVTHLRTFRDGARVLRTLLTERRQGGPARTGAARRTAGQQLAFVRPSVNGNDAAPDPVAVPAFE